MMRAGWRRCDAEGVDLVRRALDQVGGPTVFHDQARGAADALEREPVLAGAIHHLAGLEGAFGKALRLLLATGPEPSWRVAAFAVAAMDHQVLEDLREARARRSEADGDLDDEFAELDPFDEEAG
jgi:hypothetical protein